ncbi:hypothetical protein GCM10010294_67940 [Streptomyces griseoloalbus]|uniref:hypothetical protein n=1 Tax=Streptomyces griseoloalbus TaxID=67303 RepID=UPI0018735A0E|nr:hypothetical protein GCM10010294_67940 [Streptomyces griseoloalbus]
MTENEIILFICGIGVGAQGVAVWHMVLDMRQARRSLAESHQVRRRSAGDAFLRSLELYQVQQRYGLVP